jgi:hypothetical protein
VTEETVERAKERLGEEWDGHRWILRVHVFPKNGDGTSAEHFDIDLNPDARNWYLRVPHPDRSYEATIGLVTREGTFYPFAKSERVQTPRATVSETIDDGWTGDRAEVDEIYRRSTAFAPGGNSAELAAGKQAAEGAGWFSGMLASQGAGPESAKEDRGFWFQVNTELIVYGATEPDAQLTVQGRAIQLRPDGTFTLRLQLPDGVQEIPCVATSADGVSERTITPVIRRQTGSSEKELAPEPEIDR